MGAGEKIEFVVIVEYEAWERNWGAGGRLANVDSNRRIDWTGV